MLELNCTPFTSLLAPGLKGWCCHPNPEFAEPQPVVEENPIAVKGSPEFTTEAVPDPKLDVGLLAVPKTGSKVQEVNMV